MSGFPHDSFRWSYTCLLPVTLSWLSDLNQSGAALFDLLVIRWSLYLSSLRTPTQSSRQYLQAVVLRYTCVCVCLHIELTPGSRWRGICHPRRQHPEWYPFLSILLEFKLPFTPQVAQYWYFDLMTKWIINNLFPVCKCFDDHHYLSFNTPSVERQWTRVRRTTVQTIRAFYHPHIKKYITDLCHRHHLKHPEWTFIYVYLIILYLHAMTHCGWSGRWWMMDGWMLFCKLRLHVLSLSVQTDSSCHCHTTTTTIQLSGSE